MTRHIVRRLLQAIPTLFGVTLISYLILTLAPGQPVTLLSFGGNPEDNNQIQQDRLARQLGLDDPWHIQYLSWLAGNDWMWWKWQDMPEGQSAEQYHRYGILRGDFGTSFYKKQPVLDLVTQRLPATIELGFTSLVISLMLGVPLGIFAAIWHRSWFDNFSRIIAVIGNAIPNFWLGLLLILFFGVLLDEQTILGIELQFDFARGGRCDRVAASRTGCGAIPVWERLEYLILPTIVLAYGGIAGYSRYMRTAMLDTINSDYIRTARAKGLRQQTVWFTHAARNALIPMATFMGPAIVSILSGAVVTEQIFSWPGVGLLFIEAISQRDYPLIMGNVLIAAILTVIAYILSDVLYAAFDPRIRF